MTERGNVNLKA